MRPRATPGPAHWQQRKDSTAFMISIDFRSDDRWQRPAATHPARLARIRVRSSVIVTTASESASGTSESRPVPTAHAAD